MHCAPAGPGGPGWGLAPVTADSGAARDSEHAYKDTAFRDWLARGCPAPGGQARTGGWMAPPTAALRRITRGPGPRLPTALWPRGLCSIVQSLLPNHDCPDSYPLAH